MAWYELVKLTDSQAVYDYFPESLSAAPGRIVFNRLRCLPDEVMRAPGDKFSDYLNHVLRALQRFNDSGDFIQSGYVAWC